MTSRWPWDVLGLDGPADRTQVRRAYASKLKMINPEDDPEGFQALRTAYEAALVQTAGRRPAEPGVTPQSSAAVSPEAASDISQASPKSADLIGNKAIAQQSARLGLQAFLAAPELPEPELLQAALDEVLDPEALNGVSAYAETELWLASLIVANIPRSDPLLDAVFDRLRWSALADGRATAPVIRHAIARQDDRLVLRGLMRGGSPHNKAYLALCSHVQRRTTLGGFFATALARNVQDLLQKIRTQHPSLILDLDPVAVRWWDDYLSRPLAPPWALWFVVIAPVIMTLAVSVRASNHPLDWLATYIGVLAICVGLVATGLFGIARARRWWKAGPSWNAPAWQRIGWAPALAALLLLSATLPSHPVLATLLTIAIFASAGWVLITGERDRQPVRQRNGGKVSSGRIAIARAPPILFVWFVAVCRLSGLPLFSPMAVALVGGLVATIWGEVQLVEFWAIAARGARRWWLVACLAFVTTVAAVLLRNSFTDPKSLLVAAALVAIAVLADKAPTRLTRWPITAVYQRLLYMAGMLSVIPCLSLIFSTLDWPARGGLAILIILGGWFLLLGPCLTVTEILVGDQGRRVRKAG